jgi:trans-2,3-dihydro-3-hydroxyanthranilate isomerase
MTQRIHIVDVFAEQPYAGNPLAVVIGAAPLDDAVMQRIAAEMNFSETTFLSSVPEADGGYRVRIYTPAREIAFAGHPILGTAWVIRQQLAPGAAEIRLNLAVGPLAVRFEIDTSGREAAWFQAPAVQLGTLCAHAEIAPALGLRLEDLDTAYPVQMAAAGTAAMLVPLSSLDALRRARLNLDRYASLAQQGLPPLTYLFCRETRTPGYDLAARFFFEAHGVREDPATGNGAAFLGHWLLRHAYFPQPRLDLRIEQGQEVQRPSLVLLRAARDGEQTRVSVGGYVVATLKGELL